MLIKQVVLDQIIDGQINLIFRKWRRATVKQGGQLRTAVGMLNIVAIDQITKSAITVNDAARAGFDSRSELLRELDTRAEGQIYRIEVEYGGPDPRVTLRENADLSGADIADITVRLERLDKVSKRGAWTTTFLHLLDENPQVRAPDLAEGLGLDKATFKNNVRKLKELGLTISFSPGYELSPRGKAYLDCIASATATEKEM